MKATLDPAADQAIDWMMTLRVDPSRRPAFEHWLGADPAHAQAWVHLQGRVGAPFERLRSLGTQTPAHAQHVREVILEPLVSRRSVLRGMAALGLLGGAAWLGAGSAPAQIWLADVSTGTGERRRVTLPDGSRLTLNACSAVDLHFNAHERCVRLRRGAVVVDVQPDPRPLRIVSTQATFSSQQGGRWMVSQAAEASVVLALAGSVQTQRHGSSQVRTVAAGEALRIDQHGLRPLGQQAHRADWVDGLFSALDEPLETLVEALRPYRPGLIRVSPDIRQLRVQGVFALDQPDQALDTMAQTLPVRIERFSPWLVLISRRA